MVDPLREIFPNLGVYQVSSPPSEKYNCIAWAAGDATQWWWPEEGPGIFWPAEIPKEETISAFVAVFAHLGYSQCPNADNENGFERIALYATQTVLPFTPPGNFPGGAGPASWVEPRTSSTRCIISKARNMAR